MSREESLVAVLNAARALRADVGAVPPRAERHPITGMPVTVPVPIGILAQLYAAVDAVDGAPAPPMRPPGLCQGSVECWRRAEVGNTCFLHSEIAQKPHPWESAQMRAPLFQESEKLAE